MSYKHQYIENYWSALPVPLCMRDLETSELGCTIAFPNSDRETWLLGTQSLYVRLRNHRMGYAWFTSSRPDSGFSFYGIQYLPAGDPEGTYKELVHPSILELIASREYPDFLPSVHNNKGAWL